MAPPLDVMLVNNLWVIICGLLVFIMTVSVGFLEVGELGTDMEISLLKTMLITGSAICKSAAHRGLVVYCRTGSDNRDLLPLRDGLRICHPSTRGGRCLT